MIVIVMGVCGCGKSTVGKYLADGLDGRFEEGDRYHPPANVEKMSRGVALTDEDRWPWLEGVAAEIDRALGAGENVVFACSALKESYRRVLVGERENVFVVYLRGAPELIGERMAQRRHHYMPNSLLPSQFAILEAPAPAPHVVVVDITDPPDAIAAEALRAIRAVTDAPPPPE